MRFKNPHEAGQFARRKREEMTQDLPQDIDVTQTDGAVEPTSGFYKKIFELQGAVEKEREHAGGMDYREYAGRLWSAIAGEEPSEGNSNFTTFRASLITRLHDMGTKVLLYPHATESFEGLVGAYKDVIRHLSLWSQGDVDATGYQTGKIASSGVIGTFTRRVAERMRGDARTFLDERTSYDVAGNKFDALVEYVRGVSVRGSSIRLVIIEDQPKNFEKAREAIREALGEEASERVEIVSIWAVYSREGLSAREKEGVSLEEFKQRHAGHHPIGSFAELLDTKTFEPLLKGSHVFVDFDGVLANNLSLRDAQAAATLSAAVDGLSKERGLDREHTRERILQKFEK